MHTKSISWINQTPTKVKQDINDLFSAILLGNPYILVVQEILS